MSPKNDGSRFQLRSAADGPKGPLRRILHAYGRPYRRLTALAVIASVLFPALAVLPPYLLQVAIDAVLLEQRPFSVAGQSPDWISEDRTAQLVVITVLLVTVVGAAAVTSAVSTLAWGRVAQRIQHDIRTASYRALQERPLASIHGEQRGQLLSVLSNDVDELDRLLRRGGKESIELVVRLLGVTCVLFVLHWQLALVALAVIPPTVLLTGWFFSRIRPIHRAIRQQIGRLNARIENNLDGITTIKTYGTTDREARRIKEGSRRVFRAKWQAAVWNAGVFPAIGFVNAVGFSVMLLLGGFWIVNGPPFPGAAPLTVGTLVAFLVYNHQLRDPLIDVGAVVNTYVELMAAMERISRLDVEPPEVSPSPRDMNRCLASGPVELDRVSFGYRADQPVIDGIDAQFPGTSMIGIVGPSGSGKTTLARLLVRYYDPDRGEIRIAGENISEVSRQTFRESVAMVAQQAHILPETVRANVAYGCDADEAEIRAALEAAGAANFVAELPDGLDTPVGQGGVALSGGQRQRIALARAIAHDARILILDEATSDVDPDVEVRLRRTFRRLGRERLVIVISHRLSTVRPADKIFVLSDGTFVESGDHDELIATQGDYARMWAQQIGKAETTSPIIGNQRRE